MIVGPELDPQASSSRAASGMLRFLEGSVQKITHSALTNKYACMYVCMYVYIYIYRERERVRSVYVCVYIPICICLCMCI